MVTKEHDQMVLPGILDQCDQMRKNAFDEKGCGFWKGKENAKNCSFPACACYPFDTRGYIKRLGLKRGH